MIADTLILETDYKDSSKTGSIYKPIRELSRIFSSYQSDRITNYFFFDKIKFLKKYSRLNNLVLNLDDSNRKKIIDLVEIRNIKIFRRSTNEELLNQFTDFVMDYSIVDQKFKSFTYYGKDFTQYEQPIKYGKIIHLNRQETTDTAHSFQFVDFLNNCTFDNSFYYVVEIELEDKSLSFLDSYVSQFLAGYQNLKKIYNILRDNPFMINKDGSFLTGEIERSFQSFIELPGFSQDKKMIKFVNSHIRFALSSIAALTSLMSQNGENKYYDSIFNSINLRSGNYSNYPDVLNLFSKIETKLSRELNITGLSEFQFQSTTVRKNSKQEGRHTIRINSEVLTNPRSNVLLFDFLQNNSFNPEDLVFDKQSMLQNYDSYDLSTIKAKSFIFNTKRNILNSSANKGYNYDLAIIKNLKSLNLSTLVDLPISADNITNSIEQNESKILTDALASVGVTFSSVNLPEETSINESENPGFIATERTYNNGSDTTPGLKIASKNIMNSKFGGFGTSYAATLIGASQDTTGTPQDRFSLINKQPNLIGVDQLTGINTVTSLGISILSGDIVVSASPVSPQAKPITVGSELLPKTIGASNAVSLSANTGDPTLNTEITTTEIIPDSFSSLIIQNMIDKKSLSNYSNPTDYSLNFFENVFKTRIEYLENFQEIESAEGYVLEPVWKPLNYPTIEQNQFNSIFCRLVLNTNSPDGVLVSTLESLKSSPIPIANQYFTVTSTKEKNKYEFQDTNAAILSRGPAPSSRTQELSDNIPINLRKEVNDYGYDVNLFPFDQLSRITETLSDNSSYYDFAFSTTMRIKQPLEVVIVGTDFENTAAQQARATVNGTPSRSTVGSERIVNTIGRSFIQTKIG